MEKIVKVINSTGIHARPCGMIVKESMKFKSEIEFIYNNKVANAKSIMSIMALALSKDEEIIIRAIGIDEQEALNSISRLFEEGFWEI